MPVTFRINCSNKLYTRRKYVGTFSEKVVLGKDVQALCYLAIWEKDKFE